MSVFTLWNGGPSYRASDRHTAGDVEEYDTLADALDEMESRIFNRDGSTPCVEESRLEVFNVDPSGDDDYSPDAVYLQVGDVVLLERFAEQLDTILQHYAIAALWSSVGDDGEPLDDDFDVSDIAPDTFAEMRDDVASFLASESVDLIASGLSDEQIGHDFWLTRNRHGAGFWDRGLGEVGERLADAARVYGGVDLMPYADGTVGA